VKPLHPKQGEIEFREWTDSEGARHVLLVAALRPHPYSNILTRFAERRKSYGQWQRDMKVRLTLAVPKSYKPLDKGPLAVCVGSGMKPWIPPGGTRSVSIRHVDATNLLKAIEDVCNSILWTDDKLIRSQTNVAVDDQADWFSVSVWGAMPDGKMRLWQADPADEASYGPTRAEWLKGA
jgi:Holliday junction resolvase RusA-like endonuclease